VLTFRRFNEVVALLGDLLNHLFYVSIPGNRSMHGRGRIRSVSLATQDDEPLVDLLTKHDAVVAVSALEDPPRR